MRGRSQQTRLLLFADGRTSSYGTAVICLILIVLRERPYLTSIAGRNPLQLSYNLTARPRSIEDDLSTNGFRVSPALAIAVTNNGTEGSLVLGQRERMTKLIRTIVAQSTSVP